MTEYPTHKSYTIAYKQCLRLSLFAIAFTLLWSIWCAVQTIYTFEDPTLPNMEPLQVIVFLLYCALPLTLLIVTIVLSMKLLRGLKRKEMFSQKCIPWLVAWGIVYAFTDFIQNNVGIWGLTGDIFAVTISPSCIVVPIFVFIFSALFRLAAKVSEDSNLTI